MAAEVKVDDAHTAAVQGAWKLLSEWLPRSPLLPFAGQATPHRLLLKAESLMPTGSFKIRGATYCIARMDEVQRARRRGLFDGQPRASRRQAARDAIVRATIVMSQARPVRHRHPCSTL